MTDSPVMTGWAHSTFGKAAEPDVESLLAGVTVRALEHAEVEAADVDGIFVGVFNSGFSQQGFDGGLVGVGQPSLGRTPSVHLENACATGSAALYAALDFVQSGRGKVALVAGAEKMTASSPEVVNNALLHASYRAEEEEAGSFAAIFGQLTEQYFERYGDHSDTLARIAAKNHANGIHNPFAHLRKDFGFEFCNTVSEKNPLVAGPLRRTDCSLVSDGAAAIVLRPTLVYGAGRDRTLSRIAAIARPRGWFPLPRGATGLRQPVHVDDLAATAVAALRAEGAGGRGYDLPGGETLPYREMVARVLAALDPPARLVELPAPLFALLASALRVGGRLQGFGAEAQARLRQAPLFRPGAAIHQPDPQRASAGGGEHLRAGPAPPVLDLLMRMAETVAVARRHERVPGAGGIDERGIRRGAAAVVPGHHNVGGDRNGIAPHYFALHDAAVDDPRRGFHAFTPAGGLVERERALGHRVDGIVGAAKRRLHQHPALKRLGVAYRRDGYRDLVPHAHEGRELSGHKHRGGVLRLYGFVLLEADVFKKVF